MRWRRLVKISPEVRLSVRAAFCLSVPLVVGLVTNQRLYGIVVAFGALWAIGQDGLDEWSVRGPRLLWVTAAAGVGVAIGAAYVSLDSGEWSLTVLFGAVALIAGFIEASNWATQGSFFLIGAIIGAGLKFNGKIWQSFLCVALGGLFVYVLGALTDRRNRLENQRIYLAKGFRSLATLTEIVGAPNFYAERAGSMKTIDAAQDVVGNAHLRSSNAEDLALRQCLAVLLRSGEVVSYIEGKNLHVDKSVATAMYDVASSLADTTALATLPLLRDLPRKFNVVVGLNPAITSTLTLSVPSKQEAASIRSSTRAAMHSRLPVVERWRFAVILCVAVVVGTLISQVLDGPHGFWLPMAVAFILRPDLGPVITRALARTLGTAVGVGIAALVSLSGNSIGLLIALSCVMAAVLPRAVRRSHVLGVITFTPIVFVFLGLLGTDRYLFLPRIIDTALGAAIVLIFDVMLWTRAPSLRPQQQLNNARAASERYKRDGTRGDPLHRNLLRRSALRAVANARSSLDQAKAEPQMLGRLDPTTPQQLNDIERSIDAHTVAILDSRQG
jgi:uncharacterized membrane protein YccC